METAIHDHSYKLLFSHPRMVRDLLEGFVGGEWLSRVDFSTLERVSDAYVTDDSRARADDIIWRVRGGEHFVYLLVEFQSTVDHFMAVRVLTYVGLLYQDLIKARAISRGELLPNVLPVVLYNGASRWYAPEELSSLLRDECHGLEECRPFVRYLLIDEGAYDDRKLAIDDNLVAILFRLENCFQRDRMKDLVSTLMKCLARTELQSLRRAFAIWLKKAVFTRFTEPADLTNLWEIDTMLADRVPIWEEELRQEGREQGVQLGESRILTRQLRKRFGDLPDFVSSRMQGATSEQLEQWADRLLEVTTLDEMFRADATS